MNSQPSTMPRTGLKVWVVVARQYIMHVCGKGGGVKICALLRFWSRILVAATVFLLFLRVFELFSEVFLKYKLLKNAM